MEMMEGDITLFSQGAGLGTTVEVIVPLVNREIPFAKKAEEPSVTEIAVP
jgi:hypothetical protein